ncbi:DUF4062 domain-containing protein [Streptomyces sp. NBC_00028]|uniref:DUF4062 domain-containing protein n=1 Tax=Streptomyces sp. NBC_00028 TaxID=2975624 RepID=UPI003253E472
MRVYLSSTVSDLEECRAAVLDALRSLPLDVVAMENYPAFDERPVEKCLSDVADCDVYVGVFALRYGYVPEIGPLNPDGRSITELEYRKACEAGRKRLIFLLKPGVPWPTDRIDGQEGADEGSNEHIKRLRAELSKVHGVGWFRNPDHLARKVTSSVTALLQLAPPAEAPRPVAEPPHPRRLTHDLHLLHALKDQDDAAELAAAVQGMWTVSTSSTDLLATTPAEMADLDRTVTASRSVGLLLSPSLATVLAENPDRTRRILDLARTRTGGTLLGVVAPGHEDAPPDSTAWGITEVIAGSPSLPLPNRLNATLSRTVGLPHPDQEVGLPVVVVAMTGAEADSLITTKAGKVADIVQRLGLTAEAVRARYGTTRGEWKPFGEADRTIDQVLRKAVTGINSPDLLLRGRTIRLQPYLFDDLLSYDLAHTLLFTDLARNGCLVVADELSLLHPALEQTFLSSPLYHGAQVSLITVSPGDPAVGTAHELIRRELAARLHRADHRYGGELDPLCEMNVASRRHFDRWLRVSLPQTLDAYRNARPSPDKARQLQAELGARPSPGMARLITEGGTT